VPRSDAEPRLAALLGVDPGRNLRHAEVVRLLAGRRADGAPVLGRLALRPTRTPGGALGLDPARPPNRDEIGHLLAGRRADGSELSTSGARGVRRVLGLFGVPPGHAITREELDRIGSGRCLDGSTLRWPSASRPLFTPRISVAYLGLCLSAHKSLSLAWALAPVPSEAALIVQAHRDAVDAALLQVEAELGRARRGRGGAAGHDPGPIFWMLFHHYTARPTPGAKGAGEAGQGNADPTGSPQLHTHVAIPNVTMTADGHVGGLDLQRLNGRLMQFGALYQAHLATALRQLGAEVGLDLETGAARLLGVPNEACRAFSRRTAEGTRAAQRYAERIGLDWDDLTAGHKVALIKNGTQGDPRSPKSDDVGDWAAWRRQADALGWRPRPLLRPDRPVALPGCEERIRIGHEVASGLLRDALLRTGSLGEAEVRTAAARGLVAAGIGAASDLDAVVQRIVQGGVQHGGAAVPLAWSTAVDAYGQAWGRLAVAQDIGSAEKRAEPGRDAAAPALRLPVPQAAAAADTVIARLRQGGRARLVPGGYHEAVEGVADLWEARHEAHRGDPAYRLAVVADLPGSARDIAQAIRRRRQRLGLLGPDQVCIDVANGAGENCELRLAPGDRVRLGCHVNADCADGQRGIIGRDGSVVEIVLIKAAGVTVRNRQGRTGRVGWQRLRDPRSGRYLLAHADALAIGDVRDWSVGTECILALPAGSGQRRLPEALARPGRDAGLFLVLSERAEHGQLAARGEDEAAPVDADTLWAEAAANLGRPVGVESWTALRRLAAEARVSAVRAQLAMAHVWERRQAEGLGPATLHRALWRHRDEAELRDSSTIQDWLRGSVAPVQAVHAVATEVAAVASHGLPAVGRRLRQVADARRASWLAGSTLARRVQGRQEETAALEAAGALRSSAGERAGMAALMAAATLGVQDACSRSLADVGRLLAAVRDRKFALAARSTLCLRFQGRQEVEAASAVMGTVRPAADLRASLAATAVGVQGAATLGLAGAGPLFARMRARGHIWLADATLGPRLRDGRDAAAVLAVVGALNAAGQLRTAALAPVPALAAGLQAAMFQGGSDAGRQVGDALRARRTAWLGRATLHRRLWDERCGSAVQGALDLSESAAGAAPLTAASMRAVAAGVRASVSQGLQEASRRVVDRRRSDRAAWRVLATLGQRLEERREQAAVLDAVLALRPALGSRERMITQSLPLVVAGIEGAAREGLAGLGGLFRLARERRRAWLAGATLHRRLRGQQDEAGVLEVSATLQAGGARRMRSLEALAGTVPALRGALVEEGIVSTSRLRAALHQRRAAWLAAGTLHRRARQRREDRAVGLMAGRIGAAAQVQNQAVQRMADLASGLSAAVGHDLALSMGRLRRATQAVRARRAAWVAQTVLARRLQRRQEEAAVLHALQARRLAMREQDLALASMSAAAQGIREAALRTLSDMGPALARVRVRRKQAAEAARAALSAGSRSEPARFSVRTVLDAVAARLKTALVGSAPIVEATADQGQVPALGQPATARSAPVGTAAPVHSLAAPLAVAGDSRTARERPLSSAMALPATPCTQDEALRFLRSGDVVLLSRDGTAAVFRTNVAELDAATDDRSNADGLFGLGLLLNRAGVWQTRQNYTRAGGLVIEYGLADLARMLAAGTREAADEWLTRLRLATAQTRAREERMKAAAERRRAAAAARKPRLPGPPSAVPGASLVAAEAAHESVQDRLRRQLLEGADVVHVGADGKAADPKAAGARPTLRFITTHQVHEGPTRPDKVGSIGLHGLGAALADAGVPAKVLQRNHGLVAVLVDRDELVAALAKLAQAEVDGWLLRLRVAAWQSGNLVKARAARGEDPGGPGMA